MARTTTRRARRAEPRLKFDQKLVLNQWMLRLFEVERFDQIATDAFKNPALEGWDEDNVTRFYHELTAQLFDRPRLPKDDLLRYDGNIVRHWKAITDRRTHDGRRLYMKYFQYLALLFTEIYLDRYFRDAEGLLNELNAYVEIFNADKLEADRVEPFPPDSLNKLAFWMATGSGKTLIMHVNIKQYLHYMAQAGMERDLNRVILLTPNEGLSKQHLDEFLLSGVEAEIFSKESRGLFAGRSVEIIEVTKLRDDMGEKTVAIDAFEGNNLVLVDEGHRGASGIEWMDKRNRLCENGFSFEYSATFGQAMKAANKSALTQEYTRCILFDYSYKFFYRDGYGKDYHILNLEDDTQEDVRQLYLTACLLMFYQQLRLYHDRKNEYRRFLIEHPLWVFVGGTVNAVRTQGGRQVSDVVDILLFIAGFVKDPRQAVGRIERLKTGVAGLLDGRGREVFANAFAYLIRTGQTPEQIFEDVLKTVFNAPAPAMLHVENLKGADGEIALKIGDTNEPFGLINVGDASKLCGLCENHPSQMVVTDREFSGSLFRELDKADTTVNLLIGSKKFTEGWNSWRVSTMGLMNVGRSEGSEIIQLFGRGVRLKGQNFCLKRSSYLLEERAPEFIRTIETLNIFGIRADYMRQFKEYLEDEGLPSNEDRIEIVLPVLKNLGEVKLRTVRLKEGLDFKKNRPYPTLDMPPEQLERYPVVLDWYPKIQSERSRGIRAEADIAEKYQATLSREHLAFMDFDAIYFALQQYKNERTWFNFNLTRETVVRLLATPDWYTLLIPPEEMQFTRFDRVRLWQEIAVALLQKYCDKYYKYRKAEFELPNLEYTELTPDDPNFLDEYRILIDESQQSIVETIGQLKQAIEAGNLRDVALDRFRAIFFGRHLYEPLIYCTSDLIDVRPVALNEGERDFVMDLRQLYDRNSAFFQDKELYLLRNRSKGRGIGFFEAGNFHPDFILWLLVGDRQYVSFIDPKGLRNLQGRTDPKIQFYQTVKDLERRLGDPRVTLNSFIVSVTPYGQVRWWDGGMSPAQFDACNVLFREPDGSGAYLQRLLSKAIAPV